MGMTFPHLFYLLSLIFELVALILVSANLQSSYVQGPDISIYIQLFMCLIFCVVLPDFLYFVMMFFLPDVGMHKTGIVYSMLAFVVDIIAGIALLLVVLDYSGSTAALMTVFGGILTLIAAAFQGVNAFYA